MTAHWAHLPYDFLGRVSNRFINEVNGISRVVYDISGKPPLRLSGNESAPALSGTSLARNTLEPAQLRAFGF